MAMTRFLNRGSPSSPPGVRSSPATAIPIPPSSLLRPQRRRAEEGTMRLPWELEPPSDPRVARANLERLRRSYAKQVKQMRKEYIYEVEMLRIEKQRKADARREAMRIENEERKKAKAAAAQTRAAEHKAFQKEFREILMEERAEKLESWRKKEVRKEICKEEERELLRHQSSLWVAEEDLQRKIFEAIVDTQPL